MAIFRHATKNDASDLSNLAYASEKHLGYDAEYMNVFADLYNVTAEYISRNPVDVMEYEGKTIGFWGLREENRKWELDFFYITPEYIGKGYGRHLWNHLTDECKKRSIHEFQLVTSPQSVLFYQKMGAVVVGQVESMITPGRMIPKLYYPIR